MYDVGMIGKKDDLIGACTLKVHSMGVHTKELGVRTGAGLAKSRPAGVF